MQSFVRIARHDIYANLKRGKQNSLSFATPGAKPVDISGTDLITFIRREEAEKLNKDNRAALFDRNSRTRIFSGSVLKVLYKTSVSAPRDTSFTGVLIGYKRASLTTSFLLRNVIHNVGCEMSFKLHSPLIKEIQVLKKAKPARCKLYHLRDNKALLMKFMNSKKEDSNNQKEKLKIKG